MISNLMLVFGFLMIQISFCFMDLKQSTSSLLYWFGKGMTKLPSCNGLISILLLTSLLVEFYFFQDGPGTANNVLLV